MLSMVLQKPTARSEPVSRFRPPQPMEEEDLELETSERRKMARLIAEQRETIGKLYKQVGELRKRAFSRSASQLEDHSTPPSSKTQGNSSSPGLTPLSTPVGQTVATKSALVVAEQQARCAAMASAAMQAQIAAERERTQTLVASVSRVLQACRRVALAQTPGKNISAQSLAEWVCMGLERPMGPPHPAAASRGKSTSPVKSRPLFAGLHTAPQSDSAEQPLGGGADLDVMYGSFTPVQRLPGVDILTDDGSIACFSLEDPNTPRLAQAPLEGSYSTGGPAVATLDADGVGHWGSQPISVESTGGDGNEVQLVASFVNSGRRLSGQALLAGSAIRKIVWFGGQEWIPEPSTDLAGHWGTGYSSVCLHHSAKHAWHAEWSSQEVCISLESHGAVRLRSAVVDLPGSLDSACRQIRWGNGMLWTKESTKD